MLAIDVQSCHDIYCFDRDLPVLAISLTVLIF